jgi:Rieske 2Fe-2S family protein
MTGGATLTRDDYCSPGVFETEREQIFHSGWFYACHVGSLPAGHRRVIDVAGESVIVTRDVDGTFHAHANVCRHRGAQLCDPADDGAAPKGSIRCPYHAWTYGLDGVLRATPRVDDFAESRIQLWSYHVASRKGMVFVSLARQPADLDDWLRRHAAWLDEFEALEIEQLVVGARTESIVKANWKIVIENYQECLHCAVVHPELVELIPLYRTGHVLDPDRDDNAVALIDGAHSFTRNGWSALSVLPGTTPEEVAVYRGGAVFPNVMLDVTGTSASLTALFPVDQETTVVVAEYLFNEHDARADGFDPAPVVEFSELVGHQDYTVCERVQRGVASKAFAGGMLTTKDSLVADFVAHYRSTLAPAS